MTSKNLYFKLMKEDLKNRLWAPSLIALGCFFLYPVFLAFLAGRAFREYETAQVGLTWFTKEALQWLSFENGMAVFGVIVLSLICGLSSFYYLNSRKRVDFYHSIPVRRETLFVIHYIDGILIFAVPYAVGMIAAVIVGAVNGINSDLLCETAGSAYILHMIYYSLCYTTVVIASMLTGNLVVGFFGSMVLMFYVPLATAVIQLLFDTFFVSYSYENNSGLAELFFRISPVMEYIHTEEIFHIEKTSVWIQAAGAVFVSLLLAVAALLLYRKRPSEAAGRAMAFAVSCPIIRVLITVLSGLGMGGFLWSMQQSSGWLVFGGICGSVIAHGVIESIYHFDFRKLFTHKGQLMICTGLALAVLLIFRFDLFGYDTYLPSENQVEYAAVDLGYLNHWVSYGKVTQDKKNNTSFYTYETMLSGKYMVEHMQCRDLNTILNLAAIGIEENRRIKQQWSATGERMLPYQDAAERAVPTQEESPQYTTITLCYTLKNGKKVSRNYNMDLSKNYELLKELQQDAEYQKAAYPILSVKAEDISNVRYRKSRSTGDQSLKNLTKEQRAQLLLTYQQEFSALTLDEMKREMPIGLIRFTKEDDEAAIALWNHKENWEKTGDYSWRYYNDVRDEEFYPVYSSFEQTISLLRQAGISVRDEVLQDKIVSVTVSGYVPEKEDYQEITFTDPDEIKKLGDLTRNERMLYYDPMYEEEDLNVEVTVADQTNKEDLTNTYSSFFKKGEIPQLVKERMGF